MSKPIEHIAVIRMSAMGDVAMTVPVIRALVNEHSEVRVTVISRPFFKPFFEGMSNVNFFAVDVKGRHKGFLGLLRLYFDLRKFRFDAVADLHNVLRSQIIRNLFALSGKKTAATDKGRADKSALTRPENKTFAHVKNMIQRHVDTFKKLGIDVDIEDPGFPYKARLAPEVLAFTGEIEKLKWIGIAPFAQYESKVYPQDLMQKVINELALDPNNKIFLFGGGNKEIEMLNQFANGRENVINVAGKKITFRQELDLISNLDVMLSMDSGNAHIAAMLGRKVITLWGATHPYAGFAPFNQPMENCLVSDREKYPKLPTSVYGNKTVEGYEDAMRTISPEKVVAKVVSV